MCVHARAATAPAIPAKFRKRTHVHNVESCNVELSASVQSKVPRPGATSPHIASPEGLGTCAVIHGVLQLGGPDSCQAPPCALGARTCGLALPYHQAARESHRLSDNDSTAQQREGAAGRRALA
jgi:hypothetical protein